MLGRLVVLGFAVGVGVLVLTAITGTASSLFREMANSYEATLPATATLKASAPVPEAVAHRLIGGSVIDASLADSVSARFLDGDGRWQPMVLFVVPDLTSSRIARVFPEPGTPWPPAVGALALERTAVTTFHLATDRGLEIRIGERQVVSGPLSVVHDPSVAPASQERTAYAYVEEATARGWGLEPFHQVKVRLDQSLAWEGARAEAIRVGALLQDQGIVLTEIEVPPVHQHPHQGILMTLLFILGSFGALTVVLCSLLVSNVIAALIARERRWIGVMKTLGASSTHILVLFLSPVVFLGVLAVVWSVPLGLLLSGETTTAVGNLLNLRITDLSVGWWSWALPVFCGLALPLLMALGPVSRAMRLTILESLSDIGTGRQSFAPSRTRGWVVTNIPPTLKMAWRNAWRKKGRLALSLLLLGIGGGLFLTAANLSLSWKNLIAESLEGRKMDVQIRVEGFHENWGLSSQALGPGTTLETWASLPATVVGDQVPVEATYPDEAHGSFRLYALPQDTAMIAYPLQRGRWLAGPGEVVLNQGALARFPGARPGSAVVITAGGQARTYTLVGVVQEVGQASAYVTPEPWPVTADYRTEILVKLGAENSAQAKARVEGWLADQNLVVDLVLDTAEYEIAGTEHFGLLITVILLMGLGTGFVGWLGIASILGLAVIERRREFGIVRSIGATPGDLKTSIVAEAVLMTALGTLASLAIAYPITAGLGAFLGGLSLRTAIPVSVDWPLAGLWLVVSITAGVLASLNAGSKASQITIRETLVLN